jgi:hypothetical protein
MNRFTFLLDRTFVLFLGIAAGAAIGFAFANGGNRREAVALAPEALPAVGAAPSAVAPPLPPAPAAPVSDQAKPASGVVAEPAAGIAVPDAPAEQLLDTLRDGHIVRVGVFGDSFGDGVWSALYRLLPPKDGYRVTKYSQASTGFTRYRRLNLEAHDDGQIGDDKLSVAVIAFGANDVQGVCDGSRCGALMGHTWQDIIGHRIESYVAMLRRHGASVYWVGLPAMRDPALDSDTSAMEAFYTATMQRLGVPYIDIRPLTIDGDGHYQAYYADTDGTPRLLRAPDGVHMSMNGYLRISKGLADRIRSTVSAARTAAAAAAPVDDADEGNKS